MSDTYFNEYREYHRKACAERDDLRRRLAEAEGLVRSARRWVPCFKVGAVDCGCPGCKFDRDAAAWLATQQSERKSPGLG